MAATITILHSQETKTQRIPQFENEDVKVWKSIVLPNAPLTMHRHDHPRVIIALSGGTMKIVDSTGASESHVWETGKAYWLPANPPNTTHADVNAGNQPIEVMVVELEKENNLRVVIMSRVPGAPGLDFETWDHLRVTIVQQ